MNGLLKNAIKKLIFWAVVERREEAILEKLRDKTVVSFDVFDTVVKRDVLSPTDVFTLMEEKLKDEKHFSVEAFSGLRVEAEQAAHKLHPERDVTLAEIYGQMLSLTEDQRERLMQLECETELAVAVPNPPIKRVYDACIQQGKKVLFISDMYLPAKVIAELLHKNGYDPTSLYVSSEVGQCKKGGGMFSYVQRAEQLETADWCHVGDSISPDYLSPKQLGIEAILIEHDPHYNRYVHKGLYRKNPSYRQLNHFIDTRLPRYADPYEQIGYAVLGPMLYGFSCWLEKEIPKDRSIAFLAREGALLKRAFEIVSKQPSAYMYISRRAANLAYLDQVCDPESVFQEEALAIRYYNTQKELAKSFGLSDLDAHKALSEKNLDENAIIYSKETGQRAITEIWPIIKVNASGQHAMLQQYLKQLGLTTQCAIVDVGWNGSIQSLLKAGRYTIADQAFHLSGYYLGCFRGNTTAGYNKIEKTGFLFDGDSDRYTCEGILNSTPFFELLFLSTEGTTREYKQDENGTVYPVHMSPEHNEWTRDIITSLQNAGIQFVRDMQQSEAKGLISMDAAVSGYNYQSLARVPSLSTLSLFDAFKIYNESLYSLGSEHNLAYYAFHPKEFVSEFVKKTGKTWFLKDVFKIPLPYTFMVRLARKLS